MAWDYTITDKMTDFLRFVVRSAVLVGGITVTVAVVYVVMKLCWFTVVFFDRWLFAAPW